MARRTKPAPRQSALSPHIALLRGINVGGKNMLPMARLLVMFAEAGCADVRTYIQSGNVAFVSTPAGAKQIPDLISKRIAAAMGLKVLVITRTGEELARIAAGNPFLKPNVDERALHVAFLADPPDARRIAALDPARSPGDSFHVRGREVYLHLPNGVGKSKLTNAYLDSRLGTTSTLRNWRTVLTLLEMTRSAS